MVFDKERPSGAAPKGPSKVGGSIIRFVSWWRVYIEFQNNFKSMFLSYKLHSRAVRVSRGCLCLRKKTVLGTIMENICLSREQITTVTQATVYGR